VGRRSTRSSTRCRDARPGDLGSGVSCVRNPDMMGHAERFRSREDEAVGRGRFGGLWRLE
jgi:hypothetical protein